MSIDRDRLIDIVERLERLDVEANSVKELKKDIMTEAKARGFIPKAITHIIKQRKKAKAEREEEQNILETYEVAVGLD